MANDSLMKVQKAVKEGRPIWMLVGAAVVAKMPFSDTCLRVEKDFMRVPDWDTQQAWDAQAKKELAANEGK